MGASTWASGSQIWKGIMGTFTEKPIKSSTQIKNSLGLLNELNKK